MHGKYSKSKLNLSFDGKTGVFLCLMKDVRCCGQRSLRRHRKSNTGFLLNDSASSGSDGGANVTVDGASYSQLRIRDLEAEL